MRESGTTARRKSTRRHARAQKDAAAAGARTGAAGARAGRGGGRREEGGVRGCTGGNAEGGRRSATRERAQNTTESTRKARGKSGNAPEGLRGEGRRWQVRVAFDKSAKSRRGLHGVLRCCLEGRFTCKLRFFFLPSLPKYLNSTIYIYNIIILYNIYNSIIVLLYYYSSTSRYILTESLPVSTIPLTVRLRVSESGESVRRVAAAASRRRRGAGPGGGLRLGVGPHNF